MRGLHARHVDVKKIPVVRAITIDQESGGKGKAKGWQCFTCLYRSRMLWGMLLLIRRPVLSLDFRPRLAMSAP
jgi:hypothetical protein